MGPGERVARRNRYPGEDAGPARVRSVLYRQLVTTAGRQGPPADDPRGGRRRKCLLTTTSGGRHLPDAQGALLRLPLLRLPSTRSTSRSEEHTSELQSLMRISYAVFCLKKKTT